MVCREGGGGGGSSMQPFDWHCCHVVVTLNRGGAVH